MVNSLLIPMLGASGAALGTVIAEVVVAGVQIYYARDYYGKLLKKEVFGKIIVSNFIAMLALILFKNINIFYSPILNIIVDFILYSIVYAVLLLLLKDGIAKNILGRLLCKMKDK